MQEILSDKLIKKEIYEAEKRNEIVKLIKPLLYEQLGRSIDLDKLEETTTKLFDGIRKQTAREIIEENDVIEYYCPHCGTKMTNKEKVPHIVKGLTNYEFRIRYFHCNNCSHKEKPAKQLMGCLGGFTYSAKKAMVLLGQRIPFEEASQYLKSLLAMEISPESIRTLTESVGQKLHDKEDERVAEIINQETGVIKIEPLPETIIDDIAYMELDGSMVQTREEGWKEVKNGVLFRESDKVQIDKNHLQLWKKQYFSEFSNLETFKQRATQEAYDFNFHAYKYPVALGDGAPWIWDYFSTYHSNAIQILDYYHASGYLGEAIKSLTFQQEFNKGTVNKRMFRKLRAGHIERIVAWLDKQNQTKEIVACSRYFWKNKDRMRYRAYRKKGLSVGSGAIESAHRIIVQSRMKQSGMHWGKDNVQTILSLRSTFLSGHWDQKIAPIIREVA